ncbi:MAG TPA: hypothetical protein DIW31_06000 [Bacteroidales bacterium]|nr:hypothetical protein [Bacteroidales bacterium]
MKSALVKIFFVFLLIIIVFAKLSAQDFEVAPVKLEFTTEPGESQTKTVTVKNHSNKKASFIFAISDYLPSSAGAFTYLPPNSTKRTCANWLNINPSFFELSPGDEILIQIGMLVPNDQYGTAWCVLYIQPTQEQTTWSVDKNLGAGVNVSGRIGVMISQSPKSNTNHAIKISSMTEITKFGESERKFSATVENLGEKITKVKAYLIASNIKTSEETQFKPIEFETYPKMSRTINLSLPNVLKSGTYSLATIIDYGSKYALEGTQIIIEVKESGQNPSNLILSSDSTKVK